MPLTPDFIQVAVFFRTGPGLQNKHRIDLKVNPEVMEDMGLKPLVHARVARWAKKELVAPDTIQVWYAEIDEMEQPKNEVDWHPLETK